MKEILLPCGSVVLVDDEDYEYLNQWRWRLPGRSTRGRVMRSVRKPGGKWGGVYLHVEVAKRSGIWQPGLEVDHRDRNIFDCRRTNLRAATHRQNGRNQGLRATNTSGYKGVSPGQFGGWKSQINQNGQVVYLGTYDTPEAAAAAYDDAARRASGEFAYMNFPDANQPKKADGGKSLSEAQASTGT